MRRPLSVRAEAIAALFHEFHPRFQKQFELMHKEVGEVLNQEQKEQWDEHYERMKKMFAKHTTNHRARLLPWFL
jgi:hypothetical protein